MKFIGRFRVHDVKGRAKIVSRISDPRDRAAAQANDHQARLKKINQLNRERWGSK